MRLLRPRRLSPSRTLPLAMELPSARQPPLQGRQRPTPLLCGRRPLLWLRSRARSPLPVSRTPWTASLTMTHRRGHPRPLRGPLRRRRARPRRLSSWPMDRSLALVRSTARTATTCWPR